MTVVVALLVVATVALRGYVPGAEPPQRTQPGQHPVALAVVVVLLVGAVAVIAVAVIARLRHRTSAPPRPAGASDWLREAGGGRPTWRVALIAFALILGWLLLTMLLGKLAGGPSSPSSGPVPAAPTATSPASPPAAPPPPAPQAEPSHANLLGYFFGATVVFLGVIVVGTVVGSSRRRRTQGSPLGAPADDAAPRVETGSESLVRAAEVGLAEVEDPSREPRKAIIACYAAMERQLALLPDAAPRDFDTASEVLARAVEHQALAPDSATQLVELFDEARFSPHVMNEGHRDEAVAVLTQVLDELRSRT
ncbi:hypothetical protein MMAD_52940 [Mycolicibacterium madagascariense]|uniref:Protein-glutamine gamma-glutamyltransferase-like C-terminal domain-containing protein n=1 Tax=Mycolicibacterium madagascariense TaxID=212765 RepID=A0A7I7XP28_9MYCO|nr:DUF4129 domain-containing protein [Mycolicibacterium madagascariense]BBZ30999.1 hypothetical protein MMAD_52940 [Mycolicibacterium madagascariense]